MIRVVFAFAIIFSLFFFGIRSARSMTGQEQWALTKLLAYSALCAILTFVFLITLVVLF